MNTDDLVALVMQLIACRSVSGSEFEATRLLKEFFISRGRNPELFEVQPGRQNMLVCFGEPRTVFTTHIDVVPAPDELFVPRLEGGVLYGRGACDAKGALGAMTSACLRLHSAGARDFALLVVVGEEDDGAGARHAAQVLQGRGIQYVINGEPTERKLITAHKGGMVLRVTAEGRSCHSGYPELGVDANVKLLRALKRLLDADLGTDPELGAVTVNVGCISAGAAPNVISSHAEATLGVRTVGDNAETLRRICRELEECQVEKLRDAPPARMLKVEGLPTGTAAFSTDIPFFAPLGAPALLFGPGSIHDAHTAHERIAVDDLVRAVDGYMHIFHSLPR